MKKAELEDFIKKNLSICEGAYIFNKKKPLTKKVIKELISDITPKEIKFNRYDIVDGDSYQIHGTNISCKRTFVVFLYEAFPSFISSLDCPDELKEKKCSYLFILEFANYVLFFKKNVYSLKAILDYIDIIPTEKLANALISAGTEFKTLSMTSMGMSDISVRNRTVEGNQLASALPMFGQNRNIITTVKFASDKQNYGISLNTSHLAKYGTKKSIDELCEWASCLITKIDEHVQKNTFLNNFALPVRWSEFGDKLIPSSILFNIHLIKKYIESHKLNLFIKIGGSYVRIPERIYAKIWQYGECAEVELIEHDSEEKTKVYKVNNNFDKSLQIELGPKKIMISTNARSNRVYFETLGGFKSLRQIINNNGFYQISFDQSEYVYMNGSLYKDANIGDSKDAVLKVLQPEEKMNDVKNEKFKDNIINKDDTDFGEYSIFHCVETYFFNDSDYIICDDLGNEWADHICIKGDTITFVHSKWKKNAGLSASNFQDIVGQAIKNIANLQQNGNQIINKQRSFLTRYSNSKIDKIRTPLKDMNREQYVENFIKKFQSIIKSPNGIKEVCLAVNFLSKDEFEKSLDCISSGGKSPQKKYAIQLFWLLSSFISDCKAADLHCKIICCK